MRYFTVGQQVKVIGIYNTRKKWGVVPEMEKMVSKIYPIKAISDEGETIQLKGWVFDHRDIESSNRIKKSTKQVLFDPNKLMEK